MACKELLWGEGVGLGVVAPPGMESLLEGLLLSLALFLCVVLTGVYKSMKRLSRQEASPPQRLCAQALPSGPLPPPVLWKRRIVRPAQGDQRLRIRV